MATNFQIVSNGSTTRSRALQIFNKLLKSPFDVSPATCRELIPWGCFHHDILNLLREDDFTMTFSSLANNVKYFFPMSNYPITSFWVGAGEMVFSQFSSWRSVADQQGTGLGWHSCCQGAVKPRDISLSEVPGVAGEARDAIQCLRTICITVIPFSYRLLGFQNRSATVNLKFLSTSANFTECLHMWYSCFLWIWHFKVNYRMLDRSAMSQ